MMPRQDFEFTDIILSWSLADIKALSADQKCTPLSSSLQVTAGYFDAFKPLILAECQAMIGEGLEKAKESVKLKITAKKSARNNDITTITAIIEGKLPKSFLRSKSVIILDNTILGIAAPGKSDNKLIIRCNLSSSEDSIQPGALCSLRVLGSIATLQRQYEACQKKPRLRFESNDARDSHLTSIRKPNEDNLANLNDSQKNAVTKFSELKQGLQLLQGPPGTGKTTTVVELIRILSAKDKERIMVCGPSNKSVQVLAKRCLETFSDIPMICVGVKDKVPEELKSIYLNTWKQDRLNELKRLVEKIEDKLSNQIDPFFYEEIGIDLTGELNAFCNALQEEYHKVLVLFNKYQLSHEASIRANQEFLTKIELGKPYSFYLDYLKKFKEKINHLCQKLPDESELNARLLNNAKIIFCTLSISGRPTMLRMNNVTTLIIDEAAQTTEAETLIPFQHSPKKCLLVGDINQLPALVKSNKAKECGYAQPMMGRLIDEENYPYEMLTTQYRMHEQIRHWPSKTFYGDRLMDGENIRARENLALPKELFPYSFIDTNGFEKNEGLSFCNDNEAQRLVETVNYLAKKGIDLKKQVGIITFYKGQKELINRILAKKGIKGIQAHTVDSFQGDERDIILISFVRSNLKGATGFLKDYRRLNVAITRACQSLIIFGNRSTFEKSDNDIKSLIKDAVSRSKCHKTTVFDKLIGYIHPMRQNKPTMQRSVTHQFNRTKAKQKKSPDICEKMEKMNLHEKKKEKSSLSVRSNRRIG